jgi:Tol biopolymer transport system component
MLVTRISLLIGALALLAAPRASQAQNLRPDGPPVRLLAPATPAIHPMWSPDGTRLAYTSPDYAGLWVVGADGQGSRQITDAMSAGFGASWSPGGQALLTRTSRYDGLTRLHTVTVFDVETGDAQALTDERAQMPDLPQWLDDDHVALRSTRGRLDVLALRPDAPSPSVQRAVVPLPGGLGRATVSTGDLEDLSLSLGTSVPLNVTTSPDGLRVAFELLGGSLYVMNADGSGLTDLGEGHRPTWSPDGRWLAVMVTEDDGHTLTASDLVAVRTDGSARVLLTQTPDRLEMNPSWSPDGQRIAFDDLADGALYLLPVRD